MELDAGSGRETGNLFGVALVKQYLVTVSSASSILGAASEDICSCLIVLSLELL